MIEAMTKHLPGRIRFLAFVTILMTLPTTFAASPQASFTDRVRRSLACPNFSDEFYDGLYAFLLGKQALPPTEIMSAGFGQMLAHPRLKIMSRAHSDRMLKALTELYDLVAIEVPHRTADDPHDVNSQLEAIAALEMGDRLSPEKSHLQDLALAKLAEVETLAREALPAVNCPPSEQAEQTGGANEAPSALFESWRVTQSAAVYGALKTFATAYQSCSAAQRPALSRRSREIAGIEVFGHHPDGIGLKRRVADIDALIASHPYLSRAQPPPSDACFPVLSRPLIYDYGGKPLASTEGSPILDLFTDAGTGTDVLGVDCSGFVYTSFAAAGLKLKKSGRLKASGVFGVRAAMWREPQDNGLTCFNHASFTAARSLQPGDILASQGHVVMIDSVGRDPFGIARFKRASDCRRANMSLARFDFTVLQSAPVNGGIGIDRYRASDYLPDEGAMAEALLQNAVDACLAKTRRKTVTARASSASLVRHLGTANCKDRPVKLNRQACLAACPAEAAGPFVER